MSRHLNTATDDRPLISPTSWANFNTFATTAPKLIKLLGLTVNQIAYVTSLSFIGMFIGSLVASWMADRWGRKTALVTTTLFFSVFSLLSAFAWTDRFERKWCLVVFGTAIAICGLLYGLTFNPILIVVFGFLVNLIERGYTAIAYPYSPELFDIRGRSLGTGVSYGLGRLSNAIGPLVIAALYTGIGYRSVFYFIAASWLFGALTLAIFGPLTRPHRVAPRRDAVGSAVSS